MERHTPALYSLAVIKFSRSGGAMQDKNLLTGVALSKRASLLGYINAIRELGQARMQVSLIGVS